MAYKRIQIGDTVTIYPDTEKQAGGIVSQVYDVPYVTVTTYDNERLYVALVNVERT